MNFIDKHVSTILTGDLVFIYGLGVYLCF